MPKCAARRDDVFLAAHSMMGPPIVRAALERAGGLMLLGSQMLPGTSDTFPTASTWCVHHLTRRASPSGENKAGFHSGRTLLNLICTQSWMVSRRACFNWFHIIFLIAGLLRLNLFSDVGSSADSEGPLPFAGRVRF